MSSNFFIKSLSFTNYRGLQNLLIPSCRRLNLIGGYNGTGKSTLLEGIFFILDRRGPMALTRAFMWRKLGMNGKSSLDQIFFNLNPENAIEISSGTTGGKVVISMRFGPTPSGVTITIPQTADTKSAEMQQSSTTVVGLDIRTTIDGHDDDASFALPMPDGVAVNTYRVGGSRYPLGSLISPATRNSVQDDANRFTAIVKQNRLKELLDTLSIVRPSVTNIQLLQEGANSILYAQMEDGVLLPFPMLGDGVQTVLSIALAIINLPGGVLLLDEFDSAIHYSILSDVWEKIAILADKYNCQIFAVTHSRECVQAALDGATRVSRQKDLQYIRLERNDSGNAAICYESSDLTDALKAEWEIR